MGIWTHYLLMNDPNTEEKYKGRTLRSLEHIVDENKKSASCDYYSNSNCNKLLESANSIGIDGILMH